MRSFVKIKHWQNSEITLAFTDVGKSYLVQIFLTSQMCLLMLFAKIKFSRKFPNLLYQRLAVGTGARSVFSLRGDSRQK